MPNSIEIDSTGNVHVPHTPARHEERDDAVKSKASLRFMHEMNKGMQAGEEKDWLTAGQVRDHLRKRCQGR